MPIPAPTYHEVIELLRKYAALDPLDRLTIGSAARKLGISRYKLRHLLREQASQYGIKVLLDNKSAEVKIEEPKDAGESLLNPGVVDHEQRARSQVAEIRQLRARLREMQNKLADAEKIRSQVFELSRHQAKPPRWTMKFAPPKSAPGTPVLFMSDFQWGERINIDAIGGFNEFNAKVASQRYKKLIETTIELSTRHMVNPKYPGIVVLRGGDMISGDIHADLRESNDLAAIPSLVDLYEHEVAGLTELLNVFGRVHVISVPGNHGRVTEKPRSKNAIETNYDTLLAYMLERWFVAKGDKRVTFQTPASGDALFNLYGNRCCLTHGDRIGSRGGQGFIGAVATITRGMKKVADFYASLGQPLDYQFIGHFHTALELEYGFSNGSLPGFSEYAKDLRMRPAPAKQWLIFFHPKHGPTARWPVLLSEQPKVDAAAARHVFERG